MVVEYVTGKPAVLSIYSDEELKEEIDLHQFASKDELHYLLSTKGFTRMLPEEVAEMRERKAIEKVEEQKRRAAEREFYREESRKRREAAMREAELEAKATISVNTWALLLLKLTTIPPPHR